jgi:hypothetical protein
MKSRPLLTLALTLAALSPLAVALAQTGARKPPPRPRQPASPPAAQQPAGAAAGKTAPPGQAPAAGSARPSGQAPGGAAPAGPDIDQILEGEEEVLSGTGYTYDPGNRRDPFKSLLVAPDRPEFHGPRPEGIPGLLIDEIDLTGIFRKGKTYIAQVKAANNPKSYLLREGDQLFDGDVVSINHNEVVFKQAVQDPTALKPFREVVKALKP